MFTALWREQRDVGDIQVLTDCLLRSGGDEALAAQAFATTARAELAERTTRAYARGVFGVPSFVHDGDVFFGADRLDLLAWKLDRLVVGT